MEKIIKIETRRQAQALFGPQDEFMKIIEKDFKVKAALRGDYLKIQGLASNIKKAGNTIEYLLESIKNGQSEIGRADLFCIISNFKKGARHVSEEPKDALSFQALSNHIGPRTSGQREYFEAIREHDIVFGIGPAGTGKTYLAMACAVEALEKQ
ncbi:MAG: PhoH family protein, partial [Candidatus Omnitrophica bacterium]|nr:PhoH family protein [Candidatus Omnitrophota bacterium]